MAKGDIIKYSNLAANCGAGSTALYAPARLQKYNGDVICWAACLSVRAYSVGNLIWGEGWERISVYKCTAYDESTNKATWSLIETFTHSKTGQGGSTSAWHDYNNTQHTTMRDSSSYCLWKITSAWGGSNTSYNWGELEFVGYRLSAMPESTYNSVAKGRLVKACPNAWYTIGSGRNYASESACLAAVHPSQYRGTQITVSNASRVAMLG